MSFTCETRRPGRLIAVVSHLWIGHIPTYHQLLVDRLLHLGHQVLSFSPDSGQRVDGVRWRAYGMRSPDSSPPVARSCWSRRIRSVLKAVGFGWLHSRLGVQSVIRARRNWRNLSDAIATAEEGEGRAIDLVIIVYPGLGFLEPGVGADFVERHFRYAWCGIWNGPALGYKPGSPWIARWLPSEASLRARNSRAIWVPHRELGVALASLGLRARVEAMPEIADLREPAAWVAGVERIRSVARGRRIIGLFGSISYRKGIDTLIAVARLAVQADSELFFVAAGEFSSATCGSEYPEIEDMVRGAPANFLFLPGRIPDGPDFNAYISASDVIFAVYRNFPFQSNLLTKAAHFRKPVLVAAGELMGRCVAEYGLGVAVVDGDVPATLEAIQALVTGIDRAGSQSSSRWAEYVTENSVGRLDELLCRALFPPAAEDAAGYMRNPEL